MTEGTTMKKKQILVVCPHPTLNRGGVSNYYSLVRKYFLSDKVTLHFYYIGNLKRSRFYFIKIFSNLIDLFSLISLLSNYDLIVLNPSLDFKAVIRDGTFNFVAKRIFGKKTLVFLRGWSPKFERVIERYWKNAFKFFFYADRILVLSSQFRKTLILWGYNPESIGLETTAFEYHEFETRNDPYKMVFLSRLVKGKGCIEAIQTTKILTEEFPNVKLFIIGQGKLVPELKRYIFTHNLSKNIEFTGWLERKRKYHLLSKCGIMLFPTHYGEGMPNSIVEGMGMGLVIVTRPVGGIPDILVDGENGFLVPSLDPKEYAMKIKSLFQKREVWQTISNKNKQIANERFEIRNVVKRLEKLYVEMVL